MKKIIKVLLLSMFLLNICTVSAFADMGSKPRVQIDIKNPPQEKYYLDLLHLPAGSGMVRNLYSREAWLKMVSDAGFAVTDFFDAADALTELYIQMILDLGLEEAQRAMGLCLRREHMKKVSYMLMTGTKHMNKR